MTPLRIFIAYSVISVLIMAIDYCFTDLSNPKMEEKMDRLKRVSSQLSFLMGDFMAKILIATSLYMASLTWLPLTIFQFVGLIKKDEQ